MNNLHGVILTKSESDREARQTRVAEMRRLRFSENWTLDAIGKKFGGLSRERIRQLIGNTGGGLKGKKVKSSGLIGKFSDREVAGTLGVSEHTVWYERKKIGIPRYIKPIGCDKCKTNPYARGLCKNCYNRNLRRRS